MRLKIQRHVQLETSFETDEIIRRFPKQWQEYSEEMGFEDEDIPLDLWDYEEFLLNLGEDYGWETVFGNEWRDQLTEVEIST